MHLPFPWALIAIFFSLASFYYFNQKAKIKAENRREKRREQSQKYLDAMLKKSNKDKLKDNDETK